VEVRRDTKVRTRGEYRMGNDGNAQSQVRKLELEEDTG
jgi:hypothetical protein